MWDFLAFRTMISTGLIKIGYPIGAIAILIGCIASLFITPKVSSPTTVVESLSWEKILLILIVSQVAWRVFCEQLILLFSIHHELTKKNSSHS